MQQLEQLPAMNTTEQIRVDHVVDTLSTLGSHGETVAEIAHDARNMVTALDLYCDLLQEPGVLATPFTHYGGELRLVAAASRRLVEKLVCMEPHAAGGSDLAGQTHDKIMEPFRVQKQRSRQWKSIQDEPIKNMAEELLSVRTLLAALAGPTIALTMDVLNGALPVRMSAEDLTRILVNLVKNSAEAMGAVGRIHISLRESCGEPCNSPWVTLNVEDNGPGLNDSKLEKIFEPQPRNEVGINGDFWPLQHRGIGLSISRALIQAAGGTIHAANRDPAGACFQIELPVRTS
jgi:signal transduction histidine kinase